MCHPKLSVSKAPWQMSLTLARAHTLCSVSSLSGCHCFNADSVFMARRNWPRNPSTAGRNLAGAGALLNLVASFPLVLIWKRNCQGHLEMRREPGRSVGTALAWETCRAPPWAPRCARLGAPVVCEHDFLFLHPGHLLNTFEPIYPEQLWIEVKTFCSAFPFHVVFDESVRGPFSLWRGLGACCRVITAGSDFQVLEECPGLGRPGFGFRGPWTSFSLQQPPETRRQHLLSKSGKKQCREVWASASIRRFATREKGSDTETHNPIK